MAFRSNFNTALRICEPLPSAVLLDTLSLPCGHAPAGGPVSFSVKQALQDPHEGETRKRTIFFPFICAISLHLGVYVRLFLAVSVAAQSEG